MLEYLLPKDFDIFFVGLVRDAIRGKVPVGQKMQTTAALDERIRGRVPRMVEGTLKRSVL